MSKEDLIFAFTKENIEVNLRISENFETENPLFDELAFYLGALEHYHQKDSSQIHLTTLEKLEILCKKARYYAQEEDSFAENSYKEIQVIRSKDDVFASKDFTIGRAFDEIKLISNNLFLAKEGFLMGVFGLDNAEVLPIIFEEIYLLTKNILYTRTKGFISLYSIEGQLIYSEIEKLSENFNPFGINPSYFWLKKNGKWGLFDHNLKQILPYKLEYDSCELITDDAKQKIYIKVSLDGKFGLIDGLLNIELVKFDEEIENMTLDSSKSYLVIKRANQEIVISDEELRKMEEKIKAQN